MTRVKLDETNSIRDILGVILENMVEEDRAKVVAEATASLSATASKYTILYTWWAFKKDKDLDILNDDASYPRDPDKGTKAEYAEPGAKDRKIILNNQKHDEAVVIGRFLGINGTTKMNIPFSYNQSGGYNVDPKEYPIIGLGAAAIRFEDYKNDVNEINPSELMWRWDRVKIGSGSGSTGETAGATTETEVITIIPANDGYHHPRPLAYDYGTRTPKTHIFRPRGAPREYIFTFKIDKAEHVAAKKQYHIFFKDAANRTYNEALLQAVGIGHNNISVSFAGGGSGTITRRWRYPFFQEYEADSAVTVAVKITCSGVPPTGLGRVMIPLAVVAAVHNEEQTNIVTLERIDRDTFEHANTNSKLAELNTAGVKDFNIDGIIIRNP